MATYKERLQTRAAKKRARIKALRDKGWSFSRIGAKYGISRQRAWELWDKAVKDQISVTLSQEDI
jgi:hypothetical protein